jgi:hypothetical protein
MNTEIVLQKAAEVLFSVGTFFVTLLQAAGIMAAPCTQPLAYSVRTIDSQFDISSSEVQRALADAERIWEEGTGRDLLIYQKEDGLPIDLIYDERQQKTEKRQDLENNLTSLGVDKTKAETEKRVEEYELAKARYESLLTKYQAAANSFNTAVAKVNNKGGASEGEYKDLQSAKKNLEEQFSVLEKQRGVVNSLVSTVGKKVEESNVAVEKYNQAVENFNTVYGTGEEAFDQGLYTGDAITVYQYDDYNHLVLVLAHELGHALGIDHLPDNKALMHYLMEEQDITNIQLTQSDVEAIEAVCQKPKFPWAE